MATKEKFALRLLYASKGLFGQIGQVCKEVKLECKRLMAILYHTTSKIAKLDRELKWLNNAESHWATTETVVLAKLAEHREKEKLVQDKKVTAKATEFFGSLANWSYVLSPQHLTKMGLSNLDETTAALMAAESGMKA